MPKIKIQNYRGIRDALLVQVLEGNGSVERPYETVDYVVSQELVDGEWRFETIGRVVPLTEDERSWFGPQSPKVQ